MSESIIKVRGVEALDDKLRDLIGQKGEQAFRKALRAGGEIVQHAIKEVAPVRTDPWSGKQKNMSWNLPPGALKSDIQLRVMKDPERNGLYAVIGPGKYTRLVAKLIEFGHNVYRGRRERGHPKLTFVPARPFIRPAFEYSIGEAEAAIAKTLKEEVAKLVNKARR